MEPRAHHVLIGVFALVAVASGMIFALWLNNADSNREYDWYDVVFDQGVKGLSRGNPVTFSGIQVGDVARLRLDPDDPRNVRALIRVDSHVPIRVDTSAGLTITNITGSMSIELQGGSPDQPILQGSRSNPPEIHADPSVLNSLMATGEDLFSKFDQLLTSTNQLMSVQNVNNLSQSLANLEELSSGLMGRRDEVNEVFDRLKEITEETRITLDRYQLIGDKADSLLDNEVKSFMLSSQIAAQSLEQSTARIDALIARNEDALERGIQGVSELDPALRNMRATLNNFNSLINRLEEDPAGLLLGKEPIPEFNP